MAPFSPDVHASLHRSTVRRRALVALARLRRAYPADLARESGLAMRQVRLALRGTPPEYREPLSLERVGLARTARFVGGRHEYEVTMLGADAARAIADGTFAREVAREEAWLRGRRAARARAAPRAGDGPGGRTGDATGDATPAGAGGHALAAPQRGPVHSGVSRLPSGRE